ncbi:CoA-transferase family III domain-containing protein [Infundibulicybe gibba]|nr:CoA-transferase family III domain-containing protein [Infundibulicybe gibba]
MALTGIKVIEFAGLAPGPFAGLVLADNGADVIRVDRPSAAPADILCRGKRSIVIDTKVESGRDLARQLIAAADIVIDPFRPGVMEKLGLGPEVFLGDGSQPGSNKKLIYARMIGYLILCFKGPHKDMAGHDINYLALTGILSMLPGLGKPSFPVNLLADFAGGGLMCVLGILLALIERQANGLGQVVDTNMASYYPRVSGTRYLGSFPLIHSSTSSPLFGGKRGENILDGGAPFYNLYACKDGGLMSVGCLEPKFFRTFIEHFLQYLPDNFSLAGAWRPTANTHSNTNEWPKLREFLELGFKTHPRDFWAQVFHGTDNYLMRYGCVCGSSLEPREAGTLASNPIPLPHPQVARVSGTQVKPPLIPALPLRPGQHTAEILDILGVDSSKRKQLALNGVFGELDPTARPHSKL